MAAGDAQSPVGATFSGPTGTFAKLQNLTHTMSRNAIEHTNSDSSAGWKEFIPSGLQDAGEITCDFIYDNTVDWDAAMVGAAATGTITWPNNGTSAKTRAATAILTSLETQMTIAPDDEVITASATLKLSGAVTDTVAT